MIHRDGAWELSHNDTYCFPMKVRLTSISDEVKEDEIDKFENDFV